MQTKYASFLAPIVPDAPVLDNNHIPDGWVLEGINGPPPQL
jgi:hypothetical protein